MPYSNQPKDAPFPAHLDRWNWGAFLLNGIWGIGNNTYRAFMVMIPVYGFYVLYQLGRYGNRWAWQNCLWENEDHFVRVQRNWARAGFIIIGIVIIFNFLIFTLIFTLFRNNEVFVSSMKMIRSDEAIVKMMGEPIEAGWFIQGNVRTDMNGGVANFAIPISGPKCGGYAMSNGSKVGHVWSVTKLVVTLECVAVPITLVE